MLWKSKVILHLPVTSAAFTSILYWERNPLCLWKAPCPFPCYLDELIIYIYNSNCFVTSHSYILYSLVARSFFIVITWFVIIIISSLDRRILGTKSCCAVFAGEMLWIYITVQKQLQQSSKGNPDVNQSHGICLLYFLFEDFRD